MSNLAIPVEQLKTRITETNSLYSKSILENEIKNIQVEHLAIICEDKIIDYNVEGYKTIYLFVKGNGIISTSDSSYEIVPETIFLPNIEKRICIEKKGINDLHFIKINCELSIQDLLDLKKFPIENTQSVYYAKFTDCQSYTEPIKSPGTISRTILPNKYIPRIAMGTVQTIGPDKVGEHEHPMLEQLFLGLCNNQCMVYADEAKVDFPEYCLLHIPLGSNHSVSVEKEKVMYYVWMDFFLDKKGEEWLNTHIIDPDS